MRQKMLLIKYFKDNRIVLFDFYSSNNAKNLNYQCPLIEGLNILSPAFIKTSDDFTDMKSLRGMFDM